MLLYLQEIKVEKALVKIEAKCPKHHVRETIKTELLLPANKCASIFPTHLLFL